MKKKINIITIFLYVVDIVAGKLSHRQIQRVKKRSLKKKISKNKKLKVVFEELSLGKANENTIISSIKKKELKNNVIESNIKSNFTAENKKTQRKFQGFVKKLKNKQTKQIKKEKPLLMSVNAIDIGCNLKNVNKFILSTF
jgi:hypothetical protein